LLEHTHWQIWQDQHWAVIGPNGSGKSTLMKALCGHVPVIKGKITYHLSRDRIFHVSFDAQQATAQHTSRFYQARWNTGVTEEAPSVYDYLVQGKKANPYQVTAEHSDVGEYALHTPRVIALLGIADLKDKSVTQLSNGEMRKVLIAEALIRNPRILVLDNPFTGLDQHFRTKFAVVIKRLMHSEMRVITVTTRWDEIPQDTTHVLVVENGRVVRQGPKEDILKEHPAHREQLDRISRDRRYDRGQNAGRLIVDGKVERSTIPGTQNTQPNLVHLRLALKDTLEVDSDEKEAHTVLVHMKDINVSYDGTRVLAHVNWTIRKGEHWVLSGPNGSGKTTLLSLIAGDNPQAYANDISLFGKHRGSGESIWEIKKHIGWIAPELHLHYPKRGTCLDVVCSGFFDSIGLWRKCSPRQRATAKLWMEHLGMSKYADLAVGTLSQGEQRMVLMARALVKSPLLLILDEPCQGLDRENRNRVLQTVDAIGTHLDTAVIYVTHDPHQLPHVITHAMRLDRGSVLESGPI
jgi:molybdate transport system ATP-binding protein